MINWYCLINWFFIDSRWMIDFVIGGLIDFCKYWHNVYEIFKFQSPKVTASTICLSHGLVMVCCSARDKSGDVTDVCLHLLSTLISFGLILPSKTRPQMYCWYVIFFVKFEDFVCFLNVYSNTSILFILPIMTERFKLVALGFKLYFIYAANEELWHHHCNE